MSRRLAIGLIKGLVVGLAIGIGIEYGLHWVIAPGNWLGYLVAMAAASTTGVLTGKPPWRRENALIEAGLKGGFGLALGFIGYWLADNFAAGPTFSMPGAPGEAAWIGHTALFVPVVTALCGTFVELDNTDDAGRKGAPGKPPPPKARPLPDDADLTLDEGSAERTRAARGRKI
jgi:hypothetical protein